MLYFPNIRWRYTHGHGADQRFRQIEIFKRHARTYVRIYAKEGKPTRLDPRLHFRGRLSFNGAKWEIAGASQRELLWQRSAVNDALPNI